MNSRSTSQPNCVLFDGPQWEALLPFTYVRPVAKIRCGFDTLQDKWEDALGFSCSIFTRDYLQTFYPPTIFEDQIMINAAVIPTNELVDAILSLEMGQKLIKESVVIAYRVSELTFPAEQDSLQSIKWKNSLSSLSHVSDLFRLSDQLVKDDFMRFTKNRKSSPISPTNNTIAPENIFIEEGATVEFATLNASEGPIYISKDAIVMEGSLIRGSFYLGKGAIVKMGTKIYGGTSIGPFSKVGGELNNVLFLGYSNKGHDGYLGNAVIGQWCNIGAGTDASNLKNDYSKLRVWNYQSASFAKTDLQFCGLLMGDYSRCSIHSSFNTATTIGICSNLFGTGFPRTFLPSFSYGGAQGLSTFNFDKAIEANNAMMSRRGINLSQKEIDILAYVFEVSAKFRKN